MKDLSDSDFEIARSRGREREKKREGKREREIDGSSPGNAGKTQSRHKSWRISISANFPLGPDATYRRFIL